MVGLPDNDFFAIMRNYLGKLQTPFNKHSLIDSLADLLLREETESRIISMIDKEDALLLTSINFLSGTDIHELHDFLGQERSFMSIHHLLLNLEERLLIYRDSESGRIRISPVFQNLFEKNIFDTDLLFPSEECRDGKFPDIWLTDALVTAFITYLYKTPDILKLDGTIKKKARGEIKRIFPDLFIEEKSGLHLNILIRSLEGISLIKSNPDEIVLLENNIEKCSELPLKQRYMLYAASAVGENLPETLTTGLSEIIEKLLDAIPESKSFSLGSIKKLLLLIMKKEALHYSNTDSILETLISLRFLIPVKKRYVINPHIKEHFSSRENNEPPLIVQPSFDLTIKPWISLKDGLKISCVTEIRKFDLYPHFELNKSAYTRGHDSKLNSGNTAAVLEELSGRAVPQNISVSLKSWEEDYNKVQLFEGIVLIVNADKRRIFDHLHNLEPYILRKLASGVFLMDTEKEREWRPIIENAGIIVPEIKRNHYKYAETTIFKTLSSSKPSDFLRIPSSIPSRQEKPENYEDELLEKLNSANLNPDEKKGFRVRIEKKLILYPDQIQRGNIKTEKTEVSGMDYIGKVRLIERALDSKNELLEITFGNPIEKLTTYLVKPIGFDKSKEDLILNTITLPEEKEIRFKIRKMSKIKRLKSSLFAPPGDTHD